MKERTYFSTIEEFIAENSSKQLIKNALIEIRPRKGALFSWLFSLFLGIFFALKTVISEDIVTTMLGIAEFSSNTVLAVFGIIFTAYSIILAFLNDSFIKRLALIDYIDNKTSTKKNGNISYLKQSTMYYENILFLYFIGIIVAFSLRIYMSTLDNSFLLTSNNILNTTLAITLITLYLTYIFRILYEIKSAVFNTIILFRSSIVYRLLEIEESRSNNEEK